jgi:translation initiation factor IF-3
LRPRRRFTPDPPRPPRNDALNENIRAARVRLIGEDGAQLGIKSKDEALEIARDNDLDLVLVAQQADPPVARIMDHGKYRYEQEQKAKLARKHQSQVNVKEIKREHNKADNVIMLLFSEFGRRVHDNGSGTDHGAGGVAFVLGEKVAGGHYGEMPSLKPEHLVQGDLNPNMDFRSVYSTILDKWLGLNPAPIVNGTFEQPGFLH